MNEGSESSVVLTPEQALLMEGCKSYLDVIHAINAFQTRVCHAARGMIDAARDRISTIANLERPLKDPASIYVYPPVADNNFTGSEAWVGARIWLDRPVQAFLYLALVFHRNPNNDTQTADICFALQVIQAKYLIRQHGDIFRGHPDCKVYDDDWNWLAVELRRPLGNPVSVQEELETMLDNALTWWNNTTTNGEGA